MMRVAALALALGCTGGLLTASAAGAAAEPCEGFRSADGTVVCEPTRDRSPTQGLFGDSSDGLLGRVLSPPDTARCSPGLVVTVLGETHTCPPGAGSGQIFTPQPPTARESIVDSDLVVTH